jgi:hypothetical protein
MNRHRALVLCLGMIFSENRFTLFPDHAPGEAWKKPQGFITPRLVWSAILA